MYCEKEIRLSNMGKHLAKYHRKEVIDDFSIYLKVNVTKPPINKSTKQYSLCFCCNAYFATAGSINSKPCLKHMEKCNLESQIQALKAFCVVDAVTATKEEKDNEIITLSVTESEPLKIEDVEVKVVESKPTPVAVTLYNELPEVCQNCHKMQQDCDDYLESNTQYAMRLAVLEKEVEELRADRKRLLDETYDYQEKVKKSGITIKQLKALKSL
jgi:hypothetical protein